MRRSGSGGGVDGGGGEEQEQEHGALQGPQRVGHFAGTEVGAAEPLKRNPFARLQRRRLDDVPEMSELRGAAGVLRGVVRIGHQQSLVEPRQASEVTMTEVRGCDLGHAADQDVVSKQAPQGRQGVVRARDGGHRVLQPVGRGGGVLRERQRIDVEELDAAYREADPVPVQGRLEQRPGGNHRQVRALLGEVAQQLHGVRGILDLVEEQERRCLGRVGVLEEEDRLQRSREGQFPVEDLAVAGMVQIQRDVLTELRAEQVDGRRLADLAGAAQDQGLAVVSFPPDPKVVDYSPDEHMEWCLFVTLFVKDWGHFRTCRAMAEAGRARPIVDTGRKW